MPEPPSRDAPDPSQQRPLPPRSVEQLTALAELPAPQAVEHYATLGVSDDDIATHLHCNVERLREHFAEELKLGRARRRILLHKYQWEQATNGSVNLLILLGKHELGQDRDAPEPDAEVTVRRVDREPVAQGPTPGAERSDAPNPPAQKSGASQVSAPGVSKSNPSCEH